MKNKPKIGLALSGGGALGFAHLGAIQALMDNDINIDCVTGTSIGAIVGAAISVGKLPIEVFNSAKNIKTINIIDVNFKTNGLLSGKSATKLIKEIVGDVNFTDCKIPFKCVATDLKSGEAVVFDSGSLVEAIRASIGVPGIFSPIGKNEKILVDGGLVNNLPDNLLKDMGADIIISVDLINDYVMEGAPRFITQTLVYAFLLQQYECNKLRKNKSDIVIKPKQRGVKQWSFNPKMAEISYNAGYDATIKQIKRIKNKIDKFINESA